VDLLTLLREVLFIREVPKLTSQDTIATLAARLFQQEHSRQLLIKSAPTSTILYSDFYALA
jgi:hypothetical protein